jgi:hypothetical protein
MRHKNPLKKKGRFPFAAKTRLRRGNRQSLNVPAMHQSMVRALGRFPHWDRQRPAKPHASG